MAIGAFVVMELGLELIHGPASPWQVSPLVTGPYQFGTYEGLATFYPYLPDLSIAQLIFLGGLTAALLGSLGLPAAAGRQSVRRTAAALTVAGVLAAGSGIALAGTGRLDPHGMIAIPACTIGPTTSQCRTPRCAAAPRSRSACTRPTSATWQR